MLTIDFVILFSNCRFSQARLLIAFFSFGSLDSIPLFEKEGQGRFAELLADKSPSFPLFVKGDVNVLVLIRFKSMRFEQEGNGEICGRGCVGIMLERFERT